MKQHNRHSLISTTVLLLSALSFTASIQAAPGTLSQSPLYLSTSVEPNIVFLSDDSGSMDWTLMTSESSGVMWLSGWVYYYALPAPDNIYFWTVASEEHLINNEGVAAPALGVWRARNSDYNKMYYNPAVTYKPWKGVDNTGNSYVDSPPAAALVNAYNPSAGTVDLTALTSYNTDYPGVGWMTVLNYYPARYYTWTDSNGNGVVDMDDTHSLVEITNAATPMTPSPPATYTGSAARTDCVAAPVCTYAEEIQNFANWFTYYRKREFSAKNAIGSVIADINFGRVGYGTINDNNNVNIPVASMNTDPASGNKRSVLDNIYNTRSSGGTPLRTNLRDMGRYFECDSGNFYGVSGSNCPILSAANGGMCQQNFTILMTDGYYNGWSPGLPQSNADGDNNTSYDGGSYGDSSSNTLADVAMHYYERDLATSLADEVPTTPGVDEAAHQHMVTYTVSFGVSGTLDPDDSKTPGDPSDTDPTDAGFNWTNPFSGDPEKIDDLWHAAYNGRGLFLSAQDPESLSSSLSSALADVTDRTSSAAAVAFNSTTLGTGSAVYLAQFNSSSWKGELYSYDLDPFTGAVSGTPNWQASTALDGMAPASRFMITLNRDTGSGVVFDTLSDLSATQQSDLNTGPGGAADGLGQARIDYLRGDRSDEGTGNNFRIRSSVLGDIIHSNPVYVGPPQMGYPDASPFGTGTDAYSNFKTAKAGREGIIYIGSNDGMLHGFRESDGQEVLAYMPHALFTNSATQGLHYLTDPGYVHRYYVDLSSTVSDVRIKTTPGGSVGWRTVLIGGLRGGGRALFALDITDPTAYTGANADDIIMWEFSSDDDPDLGYTYSKPTIALMNNNKWAAIFGNGYNDTGNGEAKLFILFLDGGLDGTWTPGTDYIEITTKAVDGLSTVNLIDIDGNGTADRAYAGDLNGNLWAFDLSSSSSASWDVAYKTGPNPKPLFSSPGQAITTKPVAAKQTISVTGSTDPNIMVF
ncbi:MAG: pilus assembly protein, partial [Gammaproteobacteria bacterium]